MKTIYLILVFALFSCEKNQVVEPVKSIITPDALTGEWYLKDYSYGFSNPPENYQANQVVWKFSNNNTLNVTINTTLLPTSNIPITTTSQVNYTLLNGVLSFSNKSYPTGFYQGNLIFDKGSATDGERITFVRIQ